MASLLVASLVKAEQHGAPSARAVRAVLYEEDTTDPTGKSYDGSAVWRVATITNPGGAVDPAIEAVVDIPERGIAVTFSAFDAVFTAWGQ